MAVIFPDNFNYIGKEPNFTRDSVNTIADLLAIDPNKNKYDYGHIVFCKEDGNHYVYNYNYADDAINERNDVTGWFILLNENIINQIVSSTINKLPDNEDIILEENLQVLKFADREPITPEGIIKTKEDLEFNENNYISSAGFIIPYTSSEYTVAYSNPVPVKKNDIVIVKTQGTGIAALSITDENGSYYTPKILGSNSNGFAEAIYIVEEDGYVAFCSRLKEGYDFTIHNNEKSYGYTILRKEKSLKEQISTPNKIYEIRYDFKSNETITFPENCVLKFNGGMLSDCTIVGNNVTIEAPLVQIFGDNVTFSGDFNCDFYPEWFGATSVIDENTDNTEAFNRAIKAIYSMNGAHNLMLTTHYVLKNTIYLYPKVSLIGTYGTDDYTTVTPENEAIGCGFIANFSNNDKYVIDSDFAKDYNIGCKDMWIDYTTIKGNDSTFTHRKQTNIRDIAIQPYKKTDGSYNVPFGGIRLIDAYYGYIENVHISGVAVGISLHNSWKYHISKVYLTVCFCGFYFGIHNTTQYLSSCKIYGSTDFKWVSNDGTIKTTDDNFSDKFNWRPKADDEDNRCERAAIFPPYDINGNRPAFSDNTEDFGYYPADAGYDGPIDLKLIGFISETYRTLSINKIKFQTVVFHWLNCIGLDDNGEMDFDFCYVESKLDTPALQFKTGLYTYRGTMTWNNPARTEKIRPYGLATMWGKIKSDRMTDGTCFPYRQAATFINDSGVKTNEKYIHDAPSYILAETAQYLDKYDIIEDKTTVEGKTIRTTNSGVGANKQYIGQQTFYVGYVDYKVTDFDYYYQDVASGLVYHAPTSFKNILERYDPDNAVFVQSCFNTDFSAGGKLLINKNFKFRRGTSSRIATDHRFALLQPMRLHDSCIEIGYKEDTSFSLYKDLTTASIDGIPDATRSIPPVFAVSGKCTIKINNWFNFSIIKDSTTPKGFIKIVDNEDIYSDSPIEVNLICPSLYESDLSHESIIENTEPIATKYKITVTNHNKTVILTNRTPPTKGVDIGENFVYNGNTLSWNGTSWVEINKGTITGISINGTSIATDGIADISAASTSGYGVTKLTTSTNNTSTSLAATASAVKETYDLASGKQDILVSGANIKTINGQSILGEGNINITSDDIYILTADSSATEGTITAEEYEKVGRCKILIMQAEINDIITTQYLFTLNFNGNAIADGAGYLFTAIQYSMNTAIVTTMLQITPNGDGSANWQITASDNIYQFKTINGEEIIGEGNIVIEGGSGSAAYPEVSHGTADTTFTLTPNTFHVWDEVSELNLSLGEETTGIANEFLFQFTSGSTATTLSLPDDIKWLSVPNIVENKIYQISVLNGLATFLEFDALSLTENNITATVGTNEFIFTAEHPVASDITITYDYGGGEKTVVMSAGNNSVSASFTGMVLEVYITRITPNSDNSYLYTF